MPPSNAVLEAAPPGERGTYVTVLFSPARQALEVGRLGPLELAAGHYLYVGSALGPGGLRARIGRHAGRPSRLHWHVDYLRRVMDLIEVWFAVGAARREHDWARILPRVRGIGSAWPGFGASDCACDTHLFYSGAMPSREKFERRLRGARLPDELRAWLP